MLELRTMKMGKMMERRSRPALTCLWIHALLESPAREQAWPDDGWDADTAWGGAMEGHEQQEDGAEAAGED